MTNINELFTTNRNTTAHARGLKGTAELTAYASGIAADVLMAMEADLETYRPRIQQSSADSKELDALIDELGTIDVEHVGFLNGIDDTGLDNMLRSQQSKRSRTKGKVMTIDNYRAMMVAAIAENVLRLYMGKPKNYSAGGGHKGRVDYTIAELEAFAADQAALRKEIRNVQSKKSIMKSKEGFSESDERWQQLLKAEQQLKDLRVDKERIVKVDDTKDALTELVGGMDISKLKAADAQALLAKIQGLAAAHNDDALVDESTIEEI